MSKSRQYKITLPVSVADALDRTAAAYPIGGAEFLRVLCITACNKDGAVLCLKMTAAADKTPILPGFESETPAAGGEGEGE